MNADIPAHDYARAVSQWLIGSPFWATMLKSVEESEDPRASALWHFEGNVEDMESVIKEVQQS